MSDYRLDPNDNINVSEILDDLEHYHPRRHGWTWRTPAPGLKLGQFTYEDCSEPLKSSVPLPPAHYFGDPAEEVPGKSIILPAHPSLIKARDFNIEHMRHSLIKNAVASVDHAPTEEDIRFLAEEVQRDEAYVKAVLAGLKK